MKNIEVFLFLFFLSFNTNAGNFYSGNDLKGKLNSSDLVQRTIAVGYIAGIADNISTAKVNGFKACFPENIELGQLRDVVKLFFDQHPELLHYAGKGLVARALEDAFPCR